MPVRPEWDNATMLAVPEPRLCNARIDRFLNSAEEAVMIRNAAQKLEELFDVLMIDHRNDHNTRDTPQRVAKMLVSETLKGRFEEPPEITEFENAYGFNQLIISGPIELRSTCAHHMMPIYGHAFVGIVPDIIGKIIGLSKYDRIVNHFAARLQIQEELVKQIEQFIVAKTQPKGLAVRICAVHMCKTHRGVKSTHASRMISSTYYGELATNESLKAEFLHGCVSASNL